MRVDSFAEFLDAERLRGKVQIDWQPADELWRRQPHGPTTGSMTGKQVAASFGPLLHYTLLDYVDSIVANGIGRGGGFGCWLGTSPYSACVVPYRLGLASPRDVCVVVDVESVPILWGPGTARPFSAVWRGGGIEFYSPTPIPPGQIVEVVGLSTCGDG